MILKPQDIVLLLKLVAMESRPWSYASLAVELQMSPSEVHAAAKRALKAQLAVDGGVKIKPAIKPLEEFLFHGIRYAFPPERGELTRGVPTSYAAPPLNEQISQPDEPPPVWPFPEGKVRGYAFSPLYKSVPAPALRDSHFYELLALVDALREGRARERQLAEKELKRRLRKGW